MSPLLQDDSTLWDVCHASLKQVFFTLPLDAAGSVRFEDGDAFDGDPARLEEFVRRFTAEAFRRSPLYRHYSPRHAPSESQMCANHSLDAADRSEGAVQYTDFVQAGTTLLSSRDLPAPSVYHRGRFLVGDTTCLCGWPEQQGRCYPPALFNTLTALSPPPKMFHSFAR
jgi:hypothetical protein